jgi:hypothetical protein
MSTSNPSPKKKRGPAATGWGHQLSVRLHAPELNRLDDWIAVQSDPKPSRPEAIRRLVEKALSNART